MAAVAASHSAMRAAAHESSAYHSRSVVSSSTSSTISGLASIAPSNIAARFNQVGWTSAILVLVASLLVLEQSVYRYKKAHLPGAKWTIPVIGKFADSLAPTMEKYKKSWATPLSAVSVFNIFIVMASDNTLTRKILNSPNHTEPCLVASAKEILIPSNWVFLTGKVHADYRKSLNVLFTRRALAIYLKTQEQIYESAFSRWITSTQNEAKPHMMQVRELNMDTSLKVFCGDYLPSHACEEISDKYWLITRAMELVNFPLAIPGTKVYKAIQARKRVMSWFMHCSAESKKRMAAGYEPDCLIDAWIKAMIDAKTVNGTGGNDDKTGEKQLLNREYSDHEIAMVLLSFLFASQDAMTSGLIYAFQHMADYPEAFAKVRKEALEVRAGDVNAHISLEILDQSPYLRAFVRESLRLRPPVIMVPYSAKKAFPIEDSYTVPKGAIVIPSFWNSLHDSAVYSDPDEFIPERWLPGGQAENSNPANYLVFGSGPHKCIAYDYVYMHMAAVIGSASLKMDWTHQRTAVSDEMKIIATIFPKDDCLLSFKAADLD